MESILNPSLGQYVENTSVKVSIFKKFINWATAQEANRYTWLALAIAGHGCILAPITLLIVGAVGGGFIWFPIVTGAMAMSLITNLAAMPTKITIPVFLFSVLIDIVVAFSALFAFFSHQ